jgi:uncharacterized YigZ family protein
MIHVPDSNSYLTPRRKNRVRFTVQGSKFIATMAPVISEDAARAVIETVSGEFPDATHHAYAYRIGSGYDILERSSDDREPSGTAGPPMLQVMQGKNLSDAIVVATRYFGGIKLGVGGLTRAYRDCARQAINDAGLVLKEPFIHYRLETTYEDYGAVTRLLESVEGKLVSVSYTESVILEVTLPLRQAEKFTVSYESTTRGRGTCQHI